MQIEVTIEKTVNGDVSETQQGWSVTLNGYKYVVSKEIAKDAQTALKHVASYWD